MRQRAEQAIRENIGVEVWAQDAPHPVSAQAVIGVGTAAKAIIETMRDPTKGMIQAAARVARERWCTVSARPGDVEIEMIWQAMIDELLKDLTGG